MGSIGKGIAGLMAAAAWGLAPAAPAACAGDGGDWIVLEIDGSRVIAGEAAEYIEVDQGGCVTARYPRYDRRAGVYRYALDAEALARLRGAVGASRIQDFDTAAVQARLRADDTRAALSPTLRQVALTSDPDLYRLAVTDAGRRRDILWRSPIEDAQARPAVAELQGLATFVVAVRGLGTADATRRIAEVLP